ncbi:MAG: type IV-A pilus assembly ATPase PilB [Betaproteobacteria bacterium]|nr:type IV-A pilus assembly ATPase PilB [Betaproteobacteria bacterium]MDE2123643.1 type IV-A pilus assembly ATPase PilB [Betaproteobacteria bacterium]MDE2187481.1 type IV-A pilus assembly ATPase PilB [Betaproteobacteria bacterium]MDE2326040.1 type IV-A pilus assembly ATPase PilB [Betaproteobacteria bacterium]
MSTVIAPSPTQSKSSAQLSGLGHALVQSDQLQRAVAEQIQKRAVESRTSFIATLLSSGSMSAADLAHWVSKTFALPMLDLEALDPARVPSGVLDPKIIQAYKVLPLIKRGNKLVVATADPADHEAEDKIKFQTQAAVDLVVVEYDKLLRWIEQSTQSASTQISALVGEDFDLGDLDDGSRDASAEKDAAAGADIDDAPVVRFLQKMLVDAINMRASDLHFEPFENFYRIRFRVDGELREIAQPPVAIKEKLASRIKVISRLDIAERRVPQDGRMKLRFGPEKSIDFRISTLPTIHGEKIVIRILDSSLAKMGIESLGYEPDEKERVMRAIRRPYGMVLVTGPTGSGKTVSLYSYLNLLNQPGVNISTAEDPAEINLPGVNQVNVNEKAGLNFATALRAFLRQDPDIIMVGEIRDLETADISIKAAQTGHMVFSTLHTNDAPTTLTRLMNMGVPAFNIASSVILITAQRLARKLCPQCKSPMDIPSAALLEAGFKDADLDGSWKPYKPGKCSACNGSGYKGRLGIYQAMPISDEIQRIILNHGTALDIADQAKRDGVRTLRESGLIKVKQGLTSLEEVLAVTNE